MRVSSSFSLAEPRNVAVNLQAFTGEALFEDIPVAPGDEVDLLSSAVNPRRPEAYHWRGREVIAVDLHSGAARPIYRVPDGYRHSMLNVTADGQHVCLGLYQDLAVTGDLHTGYEGFRETHAAHPHSQVIEVPVAGGSHRVLFEEDYWIGHVNRAAKACASAAKAASSQTACTRPSACSAIRWVRPPIRTC